MRFGCVGARSGVISCVEAKSKTKRFARDRFGTQNLTLADVSFPSFRFFVASTRSTRRGVGGRERRRERHALTRYDGLLRRIDTYDRDQTSHTTTCDGPAVELRERTEYGHLLEKQEKRHPIVSSSLRIMK